MNQTAIRLVHTSLRYTLLRQARMNFERTPKPANLCYLADHPSSDELQELYQWNPGDVAIHVLERNQVRLQQRISDGVYGTSYQRCGFSDFVNQFAALPSGMCPPERDYHLVGAELSFKGPSTQELSTLLDFFGDDRFVKPGLGTAIAIKVQLPAAIDVALCRAISRTLDDGIEESWPLTPSRLAAYLAALVADSHPSLEVQILAHEDGEQLHSYCQTARLLLQVSKEAGPLHSAQRPAQLTTPMGDDTVGIGRIFLPTGKRPPLRPRATSKAG